MKYTLALSALVALANNKQVSYVSAEELPITTSDVFIQSGEVSESSINIMGRCNNAADSTMKLVLNGIEKESAAVTSSTDYTHTFQVNGLSSNTHYKYKIRCEPSDGTEIALESREGSFVTVPGAEEETDFNFVWFSCIAGTTFGRNPDWSITHEDGTVMKGGYIVFEAMEKLNPEFIVAQGDLVYYPYPIPPVKTWTNGSDGEVLGSWTNNPSLDYVSASLDEYRTNWKYNHGDEKFQSILSKTPIFVQVDENDLLSNWYPHSDRDQAYTDTLQVLHEFNPIVPEEPLYRSQRFGKHLEIFFVQLSWYKGPNAFNNGTVSTGVMGTEQADWLKSALKSSTATWKLLTSHTPLSRVSKGRGDFYSYEHEAPQIKHREAELQDLFSFIKSNGITGVHSITSDAHYTAYVTLDPERVEEGGFKDFTYMHEFNAGPAHAGAFGPNILDAGWGAQQEFARGPALAGYTRWANLAPELYEFATFGHAMVSQTGDLTLELISLDGKSVVKKKLTPSIDVPADSKSVMESMHKETHAAVVDSVAPASKTRTSPAGMKTLSHALAATFVALAAFFSFY